MDFETRGGETGVRFSSENVGSSAVSEFGEMRPNFDRAGERDARGTEDGAFTNMEARTGGEAAPQGNEVDQNTTNPAVSTALGVAAVGVAHEAQGGAVIPGVTAGDNRTKDEVRIEAPEVAKDGDRMEKDWMEKAREVVRSTRNDPSKRLVQVSLLREEYMRKRFNRILGGRNE